MAWKVSVRSLHTLRNSPWRCCQYEVTRYIRAVRNFSTTPIPSEEQTERPRWSYTPPQMKAPFHPRIKDPSKAWVCNEDPAKLDHMYIGLLGRGGDKVLSDEIKWLAITHKSFDQGRRGFNDRLAYFGKRILLLQTSLALLSKPAQSQSSTGISDDYGRVPFQHPALDSLSNLSTQAVNDILAKEKTCEVAQSFGIGAVTRWKPRNPTSMQGSGSDVVFSTSLYAIIGAIALQKGGEAANEVARTRILSRLGVYDHVGV